MAFAQLTYRESLRDIEACLRAMGTKRYHLGFRGKVARSTLVDANELRDWRIFADFAHILIDVADHSTPPIRSTLISIRACTRWIRPPSIYAWHCFRGPGSASVKVS
jgi:hypothetical protein